METDSGLPIVDCRLSIADGGLLAAGCWLLILQGGNECRETTNGQLNLRELEPHLRHYLQPQIASEGSGSPGGEDFDRILRPTSIPVRELLLRLVGQCHPPQPVLLRRQE
jgi:hypothetical protein